MPDNTNQLAPPPYHDPDVNSQVWRNWFALLAVSAGGGSNTTTTVTNTVEDNIFTARASTAIPAGGCVYTSSNGQVAVASSDDLTTRDIVGVVGQAYSVGETATVYTCGQLALTYSGLTPGSPLFVGSSGQITHTPPTSGYVKLVGTATGLTTMVLHWEPSIELFTASPANASYYEEVIADAPYLYYRLDETPPTSTDGGAAADSSGNGRPGILRVEALEETSLTDDGVFAVDLSDTTEPRYVTVNTTLALTHDAGSVEFLFKPYWSDSDGETHELLTNQTGNDVFQITKFSDNSWYMGWVVNNVDRRVAVTTPAAVDSGQTYHFVITWAVGTGTIVYLNGSVFGQNLTLPEVPQPGDLTANTFFGARATVSPYSVPDVGSDMIADEFAIYDTALSADRVSAHYEASIG